MSLWIQHEMYCNDGAEFWGSGSQKFYLELRLKTPYNFPLFGCFFQFPSVKNSPYYFHSGFELTTVVKVPYVSHLAFLSLQMLHYVLLLGGLGGVQLSRSTYQNIVFSSRGSLHDGRNVCLPSFVLRFKSAALSILSFLKLQKRNGGIRSETYSELKWFVCVGGWGGAHEIPWRESEDAKTPHIDL